MPTRDDRIRTKSAERRRRRKAETRRAILDAAAALFREHGFERFSLRSVAEATGYSATTVYLYFDDKDDLLFHVAILGFARFGETLQTAYDATEDPIERLEGLGRAYVRFGLDHPVHYRLMFMQRAEFLEREPPEGLEPPIDAFGLLVRTVRECIAAGRIREADATTHATAIWAAVHGLVALAISTPYVDAEASPALVDATLTMIVDGVRPRGSAPEGGEP